MSYEMQIMIWDEKWKTKKWKSIRCSGKNGYIYRYKTKKAAENMINICYPMMLNEEKRIIEVDEKSNMND